jgi:hypothetical protein
VDNYRAGVNWFHKNLEESSEKLKEGPAWMIDAFGHSLASMRLQKMNNMDRLVLNRMQTMEKKARGMSQELTFDWIYNQNQIIDQISSKKSNTHVPTWNM